MIINNRVKFVYYPIGKTGSTSVDYWLRQHYEGTKYHPRNRKHIVEQDERFANYCTFTTVRNPWKRYVSLYKYRKQIAKTSYYVTFEDFVLDQQDLSEYVGLILREYRIDKYVRIENVNEDMSTLSFVDRPVDIGHLNSGKVFETCKFTQEMQDLIIAKCPDFALGGYDLECPEDLKE